MNKILLNSFLCICLFAGFNTSAQSEKKIAGIVGFYNVENLFDTENDEGKDDAQYLPEGDYLWTPDKYQIKLTNLAKVINSMTGNYSPDILGLVEIENRRVLEDLVGHKDMKKNGYQIIHFESPDRRGVDVGLLYKPKTFTPFHTKALELQNPADTSFKTRDILYVKGLFQRKDTLHVFVNHWPSRRGGKEDMRILAGKLARNAVDSILQINPKAKIILMGDFNDDPTNKSIQRELRAIGKEKKMVDGDLFNASYKSFKQGHGSLRYNGASNLFDQIIVSQGFMEKNTDDVFYMDGSFRVFSPNWLFNQSGKDTGTPFRTFSRGVFVGGYSDHLPTFIVIGGK